MSEGVLTSDQLKQAYCDLAAPSKSTAVYKGQCDYLVLHNGNLRHTVKKLAAKIKRTVLKPVPIIGRGLSGALVIPMLADLLEMPFGIVRKPDDGSHSSVGVECGFDPVIQCEYIIVDDQIASGRTIDTIVDAMRPLTCRAIYLYKHSSILYTDHYGAIPVHAV